VLEGIGSQCPLKENLSSSLKLECDWNNFKKETQYMALDFWYMYDKLYTN
jgi:hypothetical protein